MASTNHTGVLKRAKAAARGVLEELQLPARAKAERRHDRRGLPESDPGIPAAVAAMTDWLCRAQDRSTTADGGVARDYSLVTGWSTSYPETTGYIIPTFFDMAGHLQRPELRDRAQRMLDWCLRIQLADGAFQGGRIDSTPVKATTFNTGQILLGLARGVEECGELYREACERAAQWLVDTQDEDGCWRRFPSPFTQPGEKTYETHVSWGLLESARALSRQDFHDAALRQVRWALTKQRENGWLADCCLDTPLKPLTHTIGYAVRGMLEAYRASREEAFLAAALRTGRAVAAQVGPDGHLAGQYDSDWRPAAGYVCLTGSVQNAHCLLMLYQETGNRDLLDAARRLNRFVRRTVRLEGPEDTVGGVKGSFPVNGGYGRWSYLNWAAKFAIDSNVLEASVLGELAGAQTRSDG